MGAILCLHFLLFFFFAFLWKQKNPWHMEVPRSRGRIGAIAASLHHSCWFTPQAQQCQIPTASVTYTTAHGDAGSLTHWARPGIEPTTSWFLVRFVNPWAMTGTPSHSFLFFLNFFSPRFCPFSPHSKNHFMDGFKYILFPCFRVD